MNLTYRELAAEIANMTEEQKDSNVTVMVEDVGEYYPIHNQALKYAEKEYNDVLDSDHPFIIL